MNEISVRGFQKKYESEIAEAKKKGQSISPHIEKVPQQGRPLFMGTLHGMVQKYLTAISNRRSILSIGIAVNTAKALLATPD